MSDQWHLMQDGQRYGPYTGDQLVQFVQEGRIVHESLLWTEGLENWVSASAVEGLFPPAMAGPAAHRPARLAGGGPQGIASQGALAGRHPAAGGPYPAMVALSSSFGMVAGLVAGGLALQALSVGLMLGGKIKQTASGDNSQIIMVMVLLVIGFACTVAGGIVSYVYLARLWSCLRHGRPRTTPGKAVGLLFVPFFNLYWIFVAFYGLAQDWNRITRHFSDLNHAPKMSEGLFLAWCICCIVAGPVGLVLWFVIMAQICRSINFMAHRPLHRPGRHVAAG